MARTKPLDQLSPSYLKRILPLLEKGFSRSQARGHPAKNERTVKEARDLSKRYEIPIERAAKVKKTEHVDRFPTIGTIRFSETVTGYDPAEVQRFIDNTGPGYVGTSIRVRLKDGRYYQSRVFGTASLGNAFYAGLQSQYLFSDDDVAEIEYFNTEDAAA